MTTSEFTDAVDGMINDLINGISTEKEFRDQILDLLLEVVTGRLEGDK